MVVMSLQPFAVYSQAPQTVVVLTALLVCLAPTTIGALLSAIGIAGMDRLVQRNVLAMSGRAVEAAGDVSTLLLDKTGTITYGNRMAAEFLPVTGVDEPTLAAVALLSSLADETPEGRSIVSLAEERYGLVTVDMPGAELVPFTAQTRMSGIEWEGRSIRKGAADSVQRWVVEQGGTEPSDLDGIVAGIAGTGGTPLVVAEGTQVLGVIHLKDTVKTGISAKFDEMRAMGIRTVMITGDNPITAAAIAREAGVDDFLAEATPEDKMARIRAEQAGGKLVAMTGDGTNDAPALAQADVGVAMNTGTQAAKEAGNMVDLDSNPTKLLEIVEIGKQLLITRGSLTTFSIANDVGKYFAIIPAMFAGVYPELSTLNIMHLSNPHTAILSAVIFNAIIIVLLIPLALRGVKFRGGQRPGHPASQHAHLRRGRRDRSIRRHQAHRCRPHRPRGALMRRQALTAVMLLACLAVLTGLVYPLVVFGIGQAAFAHQANGSFVTRNGVVVGSSLLGQNFVDAKGNPLRQYFQPRPSDSLETSYNAAGSAASNLGPGDPRLVGFQPGLNTVGLNGQPSKTNVFATKADPYCVPTDPSAAPVIAPSAGQKYARTKTGQYVCYPNTVPQRAIAYRLLNGVSAATKLPSDAVTASGSGLDPDISVANARLQAPRVAQARHLPLATVTALIAKKTSSRTLGVLGERTVNVLDLNLALDDVR